MKTINIYINEKLILNKQTKLMKPQSFEELHAKCVDDNYLRSLSEKEKENYIRVFMHIDDDSHMYSDAFGIHINDLVDYMSRSTINNSDKLFNVLYKIARNNYNKKIDDIRLLYWDRSRYNDSYEEFGRKHKIINGYPHYKCRADFFNSSFIMNKELRNKLESVLK